MTLYYILAFLIGTDYSSAEDASSVSASCSPEDVTEMYDVCSFFFIDNAFDVTTLKFRPEKLVLGEKLDDPKNASGLREIVENRLAHITNCSDKNYFIDSFVSLVNSKNVKPSSPKIKYKDDVGKGAGIVATKDLPAYFELDELSAIFSSPLDDSNPVHNGYHKFTVFVDDTIGAGPFSFINHRCIPNAETLKDDSYIIVQTTKPIKKGEEIFINYGSNYFTEDNCECDVCSKRRQEIGQGLFSKIYDVKTFCDPSDMSEMHDVISFFLIDSVLNVSTLKIDNEAENKLKNFKVLTRDIDILFQEAKDHLKHIKSCINKDYFLELFVSLMQSERIAVIPSSKSIKGYRMGISIIAKSDIPEDTELTELAGIFSTSIGEDPFQMEKYNQFFAFDDGRLIFGPSVFIHHRCVPNVEILDYEMYLVATTTQFIKKGDEITINYGESYFDEGECQCDVCRKLRFEQDIREVPAFCINEKKFFFKEPNTCGRYDHFEESKLC